MKRKRSRRKIAKRTLPAATWEFTAPFALLLVITLIITILGKPQATEAWSIVRESFTALLAFMSGRYALSKRP